MKKKLIPASATTSKSKPTSTSAPVTTPVSARGTTAKTPVPAAATPTAAKSAPAKPAPAKAASEKVTKPAATAPVVLAAAPVPKSKPEPASKPSVRKALSGPTTIVALVDVGWGNRVFLRGEGGELSWEFGLPMECRGANEWVWVSTSGAPAHTFKFVLNDLFWEQGDNRIVGASETFTGFPAF